MKIHSELCELRASAVKSQRLLWLRLSRARFFVVKESGDCITPVAAFGLLAHAAGGALPGMRQTGEENPGAGEDADQRPEQRLVSLPAIEHGAG